MNWITDKKKNHQCQLRHNKSDLCGGDVLLLVSCYELITSDIRSLYKASLVIHASNLPKGRGWSPHIWQILEGNNEITVSLLEVEDEIDSGAIWTQKKLQFEGHELLEEIESRLFSIEIDLMDFVIQHFNHATLKQQDNEEPTFYRRRTPEDSRLDPNKSISEQFNLLRVVDSKRFPAFFELFGNRYYITISKDSSSETE